MWIAMQNDVSIPIITENEWKAIQLIESWLSKFRVATLKMSTTKQITLSVVHAIFLDLQSHIKDQLSDLPDNTPVELVDGLIAAHQKLSDYYYKFDKMPYYIWAACMCFII
jgi:hypothetical protein